ncbi:ATP-dependent helicase rhp16-like [Solanum stenotomum]|uniref:ATP-dependent helicase rhp16-like n=1 Tax=Solanum stenotomum TaxID=172797 RepID=UPI0020D0445C|nr:ATP-dependent helicase rhp16-like [Solanum stenotomum]
MNNDSTRKLLHSVRRLVTFCQGRYPTMPLLSNSVKFNSLANDSDLHSLRARELLISLCPDFSLVSGKMNPSDQRNYHRLKKRTDKRKHDRKRKQKERGNILIWELVEQTMDEFLLKKYSEDLDLGNQNAESLSETVEPPSNFIVPLLSYQKEWLAWSLNQENSQIRGGILADETGMGKTIQAIALVLAQRELQKDSLSSSPEQLLPVVKGTLVICPVIAAMQWFREIERCTTRGSNKTFVYHGAKMEKCMYKLEEYDFVITMYPTIEADYMPKLSKKGGKNSKKRSRNSKPADDDVSRLKSILHSVKWNRIILDEAHYIQSVDSNATKAVLALESTYKWALTGAHLQIEVLYSLVRFLRADPYAYYFCEDCDGKGLDFRFSNPMCPHNCARYFHWWKKYIEIPVKPIYDEEGRDAMVLLNHRILKNIMLERTKKERVADLALPTKTVRTRKVSLDTDEYKTYKSLFRRSREQFYSVHAGTLMKNYFHMFATIVRLRQVVDHPYLVACGNKEAGDVEQACDLCQDAVEDPVVTSCSHVFCKACLIDFAESTERMACPSCTEPLTFEFTVNNDSNSEPTGKRFSSSSISKKNQLNEFKTSTKLEALKEEISIMVERDGSAKGVVFSQFTSFLDLIQRSLNLSGVNCVQLVGSMSVTARDAAVDKFTKDSDCRILLMSLKDGGIALDVKVVSHVFIMDTWWNPAVEQQAQDRIRRIGQHKPVKIVRFITKNTIEEKILELQEEKKLRFEGTVGGSSKALGKLKGKDLKSLLNCHF